MAMGNVGLLGAADLAAATNTALYTCPSGSWAPITVTFANRNPTSVKVRLAISSQTATPLAAEYVEYDTPVTYGSALAITASIGPNQKVFVQSDTANVSATVNGVEDSLT